MDQKAGAAAELANHAEVRAILGQYAGYGPALQDKLQRHLVFMTENRRKYYQAVAALAR